MKTGRLGSIVKMLVACALLGTPILGGCSSSKSECKESCSHDSDCEDGLACFNTQSSGHICLPSDCSGCSVGCQYTLTSYTDGNVTCSFTSCQ